MPNKRSSADIDSPRPLKQSKLDLSLQMSPKSTASRRSTSSKTQHPTSKSKNKNTISKAERKISSKPPPTLPPSPSRPHNPLTLTLTEITGDIFAAPPNTLLIHACNTLGTWGSGIALPFRTHYPCAYTTYRTHCRRSTPESLLATALLVPPSDEGRKHWIGCLFTSRAYGRRRDAPGEILEATRLAMGDLMGQVGRVGRVGAVGGVEGIGEVRMCRINSGAFGVEWARTRKVIDGLEGVEGGVREIVVYSLPGTST